MTEVRPWTRTRPNIAESTRVFGATETQPLIILTYNLRNASYTEVVYRQARHRAMSGQGDYSLFCWTWLRGIAGEMASVLIPSCWLRGQLFVDEVVTVQWVDCCLDGLWWWLYLADALNKRFLTRCAWIQSGHNIGSLELENTVCHSLNAFLIKISNNIKHKM